MFALFSRKIRINYEFIAYELGECSLLTIVRCRLVTSVPYLLFSCRGTVMLISSIILLWTTGTNNCTVKDVKLRTFL